MSDPQALHAERTRQHTIILGDCVGRPNVGDVLAIIPGCDQATITPGQWTNVGGGVWSSLIVRADVDSLVLFCPDDGHEHRDVQVMRSALSPSALGVSTDG